MQLLGLSGQVNKLLVTGHNPLEVLRPVDLTLVLVNQNPGYYKGLNENGSNKLRHVLVFISRLSQ